MISMFISVGLTPAIGPECAPKSWVILFHYTELTPCQKPYLTQWGIRMNFGCSRLQPTQNLLNTSTRIQYLNVDLRPLNCLLPTKRQAELQANAENSRMYRKAKWSPVLSAALAFPLIYGCSPIPSYVLGFSCTTMCKSGIAFPASCLQLVLHQQWLQPIILTS